MMWEQHYHQVLTELTAFASEYERLQIQLAAQAVVINAARKWFAALDASEDDGEDEASVDAGHAFYVTLADFDKAYQ